MIIIVALRLPRTYRIEFHCNITRFLSMLMISVLPTDMNMQPTICCYDHFVCVGGISIYHGVSTVLVEGHSLLSKIV